MITWDGGSNREPFEVLCRALVARGDHVHVLSHEAHRALYESLGAHFEPLQVGEKTAGERPSAMAERDRVVSLAVSSQLARATADLLRRAPFSLALVDVWLLAAFTGCEAAATPFVAIHHTLSGAAWSGPRHEQFEALVEPVNDVRRPLGLPTLGDFGELMGRAAAHVLPTSAALDAPAPWDLPLQYVGLLKPAAADAAIPDLPARFVLVSFSTTWQRQVERLQQVVDALAGLKGAVVVTTGPSVHPEELTAAPNTTVVDVLAHQAILHRADAVVTHAGHGTVLSALAAGVSLICAPMGRDQHDVARCVAGAGVGLTVDIGCVHDELLPAVKRVLEDSRFAENTRRLAESIAGHGGIDTALATIDRTRVRS